MEGVSCLCLTYGRPRLLEEAIESFTRQTWPKKELIVLNDHPDQKLELATPIEGVRIFNLEKRCQSLGDKRNTAVALATHPYLFVWDDDDIYLPWRVEESMKFVKERHFFKSPWAWVIDNGVLSPQPRFNLYHSGCCYDKWLFDRVGGYTDMNGGEDLDFETKIRQKTGCVYWQDTVIPNNRLYYIYRWGHGFYHTTGITDWNQIRPQVTAHEIIKPIWRNDYDQMTKAALRSLNSSSLNA
jgi:glycosyltransferase involved in cell wall biosynthesis